MFLEIFFLSSCKSGAILLIEKILYFFFVSCYSINLQGELRPLRRPLQGLLGIVELWHHWVSLLGKPVRGDEVRVALQTIKLVSI